MRLIPILAVFILVAAGCNRDVVRLDETTRPAKAKDAPVEIFMTKVPTRPYTEIGLVRIEADANDAGHMVEQMKARARRLGGDAVIIKQSGIAVDHGDFHNTTTAVNDGVVIAWNDKPQP